MVPAVKDMVWVWYIGRGGQPQVFPKGGYLISKQYIQNAVNTFWPNYSVLQNDISVEQNATLRVIVNMRITGKWPGLLKEISFRALP